MPERTHWDIIYDTCMEAIRDSGSTRMILKVSSASLRWLSQRYRQASHGKLPEKLGLKGCKDTVSVNAGGASTSNAIRLAEEWITNGVARAVIVQHVTIHSTIPDGSDQLLCQGRGRPPVGIPLRAHIQQNYGLDGQPLHA